MRTATRMIGAVLFVMTAAVTMSADQVPPLSGVMRAKLAHSQAILAAVITSDWKALDRETRALARVVGDPAWVIPLTDREYLRQSDVFQQALQDLLEASAKRDLQAAANADVALTVSCVQCHLHMTRRRLAK